ncbi:hypothetical protein G6F22_017172 [Rhizopus arrhizus]|nr:hypothetical protein G6F22_017172 [Rhizopus arrhizus]
MHQHDAARPQALGPGGTHVQRIQFVDQRRAQHHGDAAKRRQRQRQHRQHAAARRLGARGRQPVQRHRKQQDQQQAQPELRQRQPSQAQHHRDAVGPLPRAQRGDDPQRHPRQDRQAQRAGA